MFLRLRDQLNDCNPNQITEISERCMQQTGMYTLVKYIIVTHMLSCIVVYAGCTLIVTGFVKTGPNCTRTEIQFTA